MASAEPWCNLLRHQHDRSGCCLHVAVPVNGPDLAIYSQAEQLAKGAAPTWDNPDIDTKVMSRDVTVRVRNISTSVSAINGIAELYSSEFGIGVRRNLESTVSLNLAPQAGTTMTFTSGMLVVGPPKDLQPHLGVHVRLIHPHDTHFINNTGSCMLAETTTSSAGRDMTLRFPVVNTRPTTETISLSVLPNNLGAVVDPVARSFAPLEQFMGSIHVTVPNTLHGAKGAPVRSDVTVIGRFADGTVIDGLTCVLFIDD